MTATRERQSAPDSTPGAPDWAERSAFGTTRGVPLWGAILLAVLPTAVGATVDLLIWSKPGPLSTACYFIACVLAVTLVQRKSVFGPMVQTPLVVSIVLPVVALVTDGSKGGNTAGKALTIAKPLINNFPMMAVTAGVALAIGLLRLFYLERSPSAGAAASNDPATRKAAPRASKESPRPARKRPPEEGRRTPPRGARPDERAAENPNERTAERPPRRGSGQPQPSRGGQPARKPPPDAGGAGGKQGGRPREQAPGRGRGRQPNPERGERAAPPEGGRSASRPQPGRGRPAEPKPGNQQPPRRPRKPRRDDFFE